MTAFVDAPLTPGLASLVAPVPPARFLSEVWQRHPLHVSGTEARLEHLAALFHDFDLDRLLRAADLRATVVQPPLAVQRAHDRRAALPSPLPDANTLRLLFDVGSQLYLATSQLPGVSDWIVAVSNDLGRLCATGRGDLYATRAGGGADLHFDQNDNFTVQLQGTKRWFYGTSVAYSEPLHNSGTAQGVPYDPTFAFDATVLRKGPLQEVVLEPGDVFYMPRGVLHGTEASEDSLSFNLSFDPQPWLDVVLHALRDAGQRIALLRASATWDRQRAMAPLQALQDLVAGLRPDDVCGGPGPRTEPTWNGAPLRRNPLVWWWCAEPEADPVVVEIETPAGRTTQLALPALLLGFLRELPSDAGPVDLAPLHQLLDDDHDVREVVDALVAAGLLRAET